MADREKFDRIAQSDFHNQRGIELADRGWLDEAMREFRRAVELDPDSAQAWLWMLNSMVREALVAYLKAIELEPQAPTTHYNLASFLATFGADLAVAEYKETLALEWEYPDAHLNLGLTYAERGQFQEAIDSYNEALKIDPKDPVAKHELATVLMDMGKPGDAIPLLRDVVKVEADNLDAWVDLGNCYATKGIYSESERALVRALEIDAADLMANYHMAALRAAQGDNDRCLEALRLAAKADRERVRAWVEGDRFFDAVRALPEFADVFDG